MKSTPFLNVLYIFYLSKLQYEFLQLHFALRVVNAS